MKILKKLMIVILITNIIIFSLIPTKVVIAESSKEIVANAIVEKAKELQNEFGQQTVSDLGMDGNQFVRKVIQEAINRNFETTYNANADRPSICGIATSSTEVIIFNRNPNNPDRKDDKLVKINIADFGSR